MRTTQSEHPWRATLRTIFQIVVALAAGLPLLLSAANLNEAIPGVSVALAVATAITRIMALPWTEEFLRSFAPWLAAGSSEPVDRA